MKISLRILSTDINCINVGVLPSFFEQAFAK